MIVLLVVAVVLVVLFAVSLGVRRHGESPVPASSWTPSPEVFIDPSTGRRMRVWVDAVDGSRHYVPEGQQPGHS